MPPGHLHLISRWKEGRRHSASDSTLASVVPPAQWQPHGSSNFSDCSPMVVTALAVQLQQWLQQVWVHKLQPRCSSSYLNSENTLSLLLLQAFPTFYNQLPALNPSQLERSKMICFPDWALTDTFPIFLLYSQNDHLSSNSISKYVFAR